MSSSGCVLWKIAVLVSVGFAHSTLYEGLCSSSLPGEDWRGETSQPVGSEQFRPERDETPRLNIGNDPVARRAFVREATLHAWRGYAEKAWGTDELKPLSGRGENTLGGVGATIVDSLSTLYILGFKDEFEEAKSWVESELNFDEVGEVIVFETVIRILGGLLSAYHLSGEEVFLHKAEDLGRRLQKSFKSKTGFPFPRCDLNSTSCGFHRDYGKHVLLAEIGSIQLEYRALSFHSNDQSAGALREHAERVIAMLNEMGPKENKGLIPYLLDINSGRFASGYITLGSPSDSYFEYLLKTWIQGGRQEDMFRDMFLDVMDGIFAFALVFVGDGVTILQEIAGNSQPRKKMDHFTCYLPGVVTLGLELASFEERKIWMSFAENVTSTCFGMYRWSPCGLAAEHIELDEDDFLYFSGGYMLRPEVTEALFYMWRSTHEQKYREWGWEIFENIDRW
mmetsp:Transcript_14979/g.61016  ORF Transcript_14979/g.61016 Transcript_14979/m.61016 type:complete len:452 (+) Transcript_14979:259-1614(+)